MSGVLDHVQLNLVQSLDDMIRFREWLGQRRDLLGVDTETGGFDPIRDDLRLIQFGDLNTGWAIPWHGWQGPIIELFERYDGPIVLHNSPFDSKFITQKSGITWPWHRTHDTMTMAHLMNPLRPKGLKALGALHVDPRAAQAQVLLDEAMTDHKWTWATVPIDFPHYWVYGAMDPVITCHVAKKFWPTISSSYQRVYDLEMAVLRIVTNMMRRGARVDLDYCQKKSAELVQWSQDALDYTRQKYGVTSSMSSKQLERAFAALCVDLPPILTKSGAQSFGKEVLELIDHELATYILGVRRAEKLVGPYLRNFIAMADDRDHVHPTIWALGTRTGRMSITEPALQTLPRKDPIVRNAFIPSPGNSLITIDADQIEARLCAHFSQDPGMIAAFGGEEDFFVSLARQIFRDPSLEKKDPRRQLTKNTVYGKLYGAGVDKMAATAKVLTGIMSDVVAAFDTTFPNVKSFQRRVNDVAQQRAAGEGEPYVITPYGRRLVMDDSKEYTGVNYLIQSHAAEILKQNLVELDAAGMGEYLVLPVHDEVIFDIPAEDATDALKTAETIMNDTENYAVPITWSGDILTERWGQKYV